jgi:CCR4-NOT transcription complex subunit 3
VTPAEAAAASIPAAAAPAQAIVKKADREASTTKASSSKAKAATPSASSTPTTAAAQPSAKTSSKTAQTNGISKGGKTLEQYQEEESIYHLPAALQDLVESFETTKERGPALLNNPRTSRLLASSLAAAPSTQDAEPPKSYRPDQPMPFSSVPSQYPQEPLAIFDNPQLYSRIDPDTLFYVFYYKQGTYQQFLAAKALKDQSWRFHKQYQTWFQRHEEPKAITEEYEQGTYRFFDYESTW